ncbi:MAG: glycosyltransferase [Pseudomonadales bacterium]|nr:glycosyltransferase [Pseudomonadales bacterium]
MSSLSISLVVHHTDPAVLGRTLHSLVLAVEAARQSGVLEAVSLLVIQNDDGPAPDVSAAAELKPILAAGHGNPGYGAGHNRALRVSGSDFHLVLNPDVLLAADALLQGLQYLRDNPRVAALSPYAEDAQGQRQYLCKRYPAVLDFLLRGFAPVWLQRRFARRLAWYAMEDLDLNLNLDLGMHSARAHTGIPIISGCFMLFRTPVLRRLGGFDEDYFLYFEDFDLSLRVHALDTQDGLANDLAFVPAVRIVHLGGHSARKGWRHIAWFVRSGLRFYRRWGWRLW